MSKNQNTSPSREEKKKNKKGFRYWSLTITSIVLGVVGIILICSPFISGFILSGWLNTQANAVSQLSVEQLEKNNEEEATFDYADVQSLSLDHLLKQNFDSSKVKAIGEIAIPSVELNLTIAKGVSDLNMSVAAGTLRPDQKMGEGNYPLASHYAWVGNDKLLFSPLKFMKEGDIIYTTDGKNVYTYETNNIMLVTPERVDVAENVDGADPMITLITCYWKDNNIRLIVQGTLKSVTPTEQATMDMINAFKMTKTIIK